MGPDDPYPVNMVPKGGFEPPRGSPTTPSRWRVYQFHHFGIPVCKASLLCNKAAAIPPVQANKGFCVITCSAQAPAAEEAPAHSKAPRGPGVQAPTGPVSLVRRWRPAV
jgi:hypothetical protein